MGEMRAQVSDGWCCLHFFLGSQMPLVMVSILGRSLSFMASLIHFFPAGFEISCDIVSHL